MNTPSIFIVEDEIITARSIAKNIKKFGYRLAGIATSGSKAVKDILAAKPNLILMDILLERNDFDGIITAQKIQSQLNVPIVYLTAHSDRETLDRAKITTPFGYILKPYSKKDLQISIELALHKHQQEIKLVKREELLSSILNAAKDGVIATDDKNKITYMNPAAENLTGWQTIETGNRPAAEVLQIIDRRSQKSLDPITEVLERGKVVYLNESAVLIARNGDRTPIIDSAAPIIQKGDRPTGAVLIFAPRRNASENNEDVLQDLPTISEKELNKFGSYLTDIIIHELRTPLTIILSNAESLSSYRQKWTVEKQDSSLKRIQKATVQISRLLDEVSVWEELGKKQFTVKPSSIDIVSFCQQILADLRLIDEQNHELAIAVKGDRQAVYLDPYILRFILNNLLLNGIRYSPENSSVILLIDNQPNRLILKVQNQGIGIPQAEQEEIFEPFFRGSNTNRIKGTGLGLAIVKEYVRLCGGKVYLENNSPSKTVFTVNLPLTAENEG